MTVSMITCPSCRTLLFSDSIVCPACQHVLDPEKAALINENDVLAHSRTEQIHCRNCGEANQIGLVRCWNCSSFLREDIQEAYYQMMRDQRQITYSSPTARRDGESRGEETRPAEAQSDGDDDFELADTYKLSASQTDTSESYRLIPSQSPASNGAGAKPATPAPATESAKADTPPAGEPKRARSPVEDDPNAESHSVATGGDVLLDIALNEEKESEKLRKQGDQKQKRGPGKPGGEAPSAERLAAQKKALARRKAPQKRSKPEPKFGVWLNDVHQHAINPQKLKLKPGSMEELFELVDVGCSAAGLIVVSLAKKAGLFGKKANPEETRTAVREHLEAGKKREELPVPKHQFYEGEALQQIKVVQPVVYVHESMFAGIPVFGEGRIAVRLPINTAIPDQQFLTFWLTDFRQFSAALEKYFQIKDLGILEGVPLTDPILDLQCHYSEQPIKAIDPEYLKFYEKDPAIKLELAGRKCEGCGLAVSEDARRKEKIGGLNGKSIAKAKCPKCEKKFGNISLFRIPEPPAPPPEDPRNIKK